MAMDLFSGDESGINPRHAVGGRRIIKIETVDCPFSIRNGVEILVESWALRPGSPSLEPG